MHMPLVSEIIGEISEIQWSLVFPGGPGVKNLPANAGDTGLIPGRGRLHRLRNS